MQEIRIDINPLSVNDAWQGRRYKTDEYKRYERAMLYMLPKMELPEPPYKIVYEFGFSRHPGSKFLQFRSQHSEFFDEK